MSGVFGNFGDDVRSDTSPPEIFWNTSRFRKPGARVEDCPAPRIAKVNRASSASVVSKLTVAGRTPADEGSKMIVKLVLPPPGTVLAGSIGTRKSAAPAPEISIGPRSKSTVPKL